MIKILTLPNAQKTILRRDNWARGKVPPALLAGVEAIFGPGTRPPGAVAAILDSVAAQGDAALRHWTEKLDDIRLDSLRVPPEDLKQAAASLEPALKTALQTAIKRIRAFHERERVDSWQTEALGGQMGLRVTPIQRAGVYTPGGTAPLPSSLIMGVIPAQVAGVEEIVICTPPRPHPSILAAAHYCGVDTLFQVGGAQAIAALAFGTESIPRVDKIVGPGNLFVTLAKQQVYGLVGLDGLAGPTETMIIADESANPEWLAADLLAQAEHDILAAAILVTPSETLADAVRREVARQVESLTRAEIIRQSLAHQGGIVLVADLETALEIANDYAPEHLCLAVAEPQAWAERVRHAGSLFLGEYAFEVLGDYVAGPNHVLPTGGSARFASPLMVLDFVKFTSTLSLDRETSARLSREACRLAEAESLTAHAAAASLRLQAEPQPAGQIGKG